jgi:hypothetical protein
MNHENKYGGKMLDEVQQIINATREGYKKQYKELWDNLDYKMYEISEISLMLGCSKKYVNKLISKGILKTHVINENDKERCRISRNNLIKFLDSDGKLDS